MQIAMLEASHDDFGVSALSLIWELQLTGANSWLTRQTISPVLCSSTSVSFRGSTNSYTGSTKRQLKQKCYVHWFCKFWYHRWLKKYRINIIIKPATNNHGEKTQPQKSATNFEYKFDNKINALLLVLGWHRAWIIANTMWKRHTHENFQTAHEREQVLVGTGNEDVLRVIILPVTLKLHLVLSPDVSQLIIPASFGSTPVSFRIWRFSLWVIITFPFSFCNVETDCAE